MGSLGNCEEKTRHEWTPVQKHDVIGCFPTFIMFASGQTWTWIFTKFPHFHLTLKWNHISLASPTRLWTWQARRRIGGITLLTTWRLKEEVKVDPFCVPGHFWIVFVGSRCFWCYWLVVSRFLMVLCVFANFCQTQVAFSGYRWQNNETSWDFEPPIETYDSCFWWRKLRCQPGWPYIFQHQTKVVASD